MEAAVSESRALRQRVQEVMKRHGITENIAVNVAMNELSGWSVQEVEDVLSKIIRPRHDHYPMKVDPPFPGGDSASHCDNGTMPTSWVKPPLELIRRSVRENKMLCVNESCDWELLDGNYMAISHVWSEGIRADLQGRGLTREHISRIFKAIEMTGAKWIWLDVLSVPNADPQGLHLTQEEKILQIDVINTLPDVYSKAEAVIVLDALLLQMHTDSPIDVAVGLVCGAWTKRVWTYQEIRLAKNALIVTAEKIHTLEKIRSELAFRINLFESFQSDPHKKSQFKSLKLSMDILQYVGNVGLSLTDISFASALRQSTYDIDYARALFALVQLQWGRNWASAEQGMQKIYQTRQKDASRLVAMHGAKRMSTSPRWAPSRLSGLEGRVRGDMTWENDGLSGVWYRDRVVKIAHQFSNENRRVFNLELEGLTRGTGWCQAILGVDEEEKTVEDFRASIRHGTAYILCYHKIAENHGSGQGTASQALVVKSVSPMNSTGGNVTQKVDVLFSVALSWVVGESVAEQAVILLRH